MTQKLTVQGNFCSIALDRFDKLHMVWQTRITPQAGDYAIWYRHQDAKQPTGWLPSLRLSKVLYAQVPTIAIHKDHIAVIYQADDKVKGVVNFYLVESFDGGSTWQI